MSYARTWLDKALSSQKGLRITLTTPNAATRVRHELYTERAKDRQHSTTLGYDTSDPRYGTSQYDALSFLIDKADPCALKVVFSAQAPQTTLHVEEIE